MARQVTGAVPKDRDLDATAPLPRHADAGWHDGIVGTGPLTNPLIDLAAPPHPPRPCNCHALRQAVRRVTQLYDHALAPTGLRVTQFSLLAHLRDTGPITMKALAEMLVMDRATIGHNLRPLEAQGLIALAVGTDRRSRLVQLTEDGLARLRAARPYWKQAQTRFETAFGPDDSLALRETMARIAHTDFGVPA